MENRIKFIIIVLLVVLFNVFTFINSIVIHENIHKFNYRHIDKEWENLCYFDCDGIATYTIQPTINDYQRANEIYKITEFYAYTAQIFYIIFSNFLIVLCVYMIKR